MHSYKDWSKLPFVVDRRPDDLRSGIDDFASSWTLRMILSLEGVLLTSHTFMLEILG